MDVRRRALGSVTLNKGIKYLTIEALEDGLQAKLSGNTVSYSLDSGTTWVELPSNTYTPSVNTGQYIMFKASGLTPTPRGGIGRFTITKKCNLLGNCNSLLFGDEASSNNDLTGYDYAFVNLFRDCTGIQEVSETFLPATTLTTYCYNSMFYDCTSLTTAPELPATTLASSCYGNMFNGCISLTTAPELPATTLASSCYNNMVGNTNILPDCKNIDMTNSNVVNSGGLIGLFSNTNVTYEDLKNSLPTNNGKPYLPVSSLTTSYCYQNMFSGCKLLTTAPELPATTLANGCYSNMFYGCTSLINAPVLPATTLAAYCYQYMFRGCTSLTTTPTLPATTLANYCYDYMFYGCTSLTTALELPATRLATCCYRYMFQNCTSLVTAPELPATTLASGCYVGMFHSCASLINAPELPATTLASECYSSMFRGCTSLTTAPVLPATMLVSKCYNYMFYGCSKLKYIKALFLTTPTSAYTTSWVYSVATSGTFVKNIQATWDVTGVNGVPTGWDVSTLSDNYLTMKALTNNFRVRFSSNIILYSIDGGVTWVELPPNTYTPVIKAGQYIMFKGNLTPTSLSGVGRFTIDGKCNLLGNCNSLLFGDNANGNNNLIRYTYVFTSLFSGCTGIQEVSETFLPATTLGTFCYQNMFYGCTSLINAPALPATTLTNYCYSNMFRGCTSLTTAPALPATTLANYCYVAMFYGCASLINPPELPATTLANYCYNGMFYGCKLLTTAPELPATTLAQYCYNSMFYGCTSLVNVFELPATTLASNCYQNMFYGCTSLVNAPVLPANTLVSNCYSNMFNGCSKLNYIKALFTTTPSSTYTSNWVSGVTTSGTFVKNTEAIWDVTGVNGVPTGWASITLEQDIYPRYLTIEALEDGLQAKLSGNTLLYSIDSGTTWVELPSNTYTPAINKDGWIMFKTTGLTQTIDVGIGEFTITKNCNLLGNCNSLLFGDKANGSNDLSGYDYAFKFLFRGCTGIQEVSETFLPATTLSTACYEYMFRECTSLVTTPVLPATTLVSTCYNGMFNGCTSLVTAPELPATTLAGSCYYSMFRGCTSLINAPELPANTLAISCYNEMFNGCTSLVTAPVLPATTLANACYSYMFYGCTSLINAPELPATTLANGCYQYMFSGCTSLTTAPALPATTLVNSCYEYMFSSCSKLSYVNALFTTTPTANYTCNWLLDVSYEGTFVKNPRALWGDIGTSAVPFGWRIIDPEDDIQPRYLTIEALEDGLQAKLSGNTLLYSIDSGTTWVELPSNTYTPAVNAGQYIMFKASGLTPTSENGIGVFTISRRCNLLGNCNSLLFGDKANGSNDLTGYDYAFRKLFSGCTKIEKVSETFLPATTLAQYCYSYMFSGCYLLTTAPELPATRLSQYCYNYMFYGCTSLTTTPELPATTLAQNCYNYMFYGCTSLTTAPELPATTLASSCYNGMFNGCTSLVNAPELPANTLANSCYYRMFKGCTSLVKAPELPAKNLVPLCYYDMFNGCSKLNYVKALFITTITSTSEYTRRWLSGVTSNGTFIKNPEAPTPPRSESTVPSGWTIKSLPKYLTIEALEDGLQVKLSGSTVSYSINSGTTWVELASNTYTPAINKGSWIMFKGQFVSSSNSGNGVFTITKNCNLLGNCNSLIFGDAASSNNVLNGYNYVFAKLFSGCTGIQEVSTIFLPSTTLSNGCYEYMFNGCKSLKKAPELPATTLPNFPYQYMFNGCTSLTRAPELPATGLSFGSYNGMFNGCTSLAKTPVLPATTLAYNCYWNMFKGCTSLTTAPELPATEMESRCYEYMFSGCKSLKKAPELPAIELIDGCYNYMFNGCSSLKYIKALFLTEPSSAYTSNWVSGVATSGIFVKNTEATWDVTGVNGVPTGWRIETINSGISLTDLIENEVI